VNRCNNRLQPEASPTAATNRRLTFKGRGPTDQLFIELATQKVPVPNGSEGVTSKKCRDTRYHQPDDAKFSSPLPDRLKTPASIRSENRASHRLHAGRRWLDELVADPTANTESIARREGCSVRKVNLTISLALLASPI
jgi:hypothetical protein